MTQHDTKLEPECEQIQELGYCIVPGVVPAGECDQIRARVIDAVAHHQNQYATGRDAVKNGVGFVPSLINHEQSFTKYMSDPRLNALLRQLLGDHLRVSFTSAIINQPMNARGGWHADWPFNQRNAGRVRAPYADLLMHITTLWMVSSFDATNGGTLIVPKSHRCGTNPTVWDDPLADPARESWNGESIPRPNDAIKNEVHVSGEAGSVLVMDSRLWHATASNTSAEPRVALALRYAPWWLNLEVLRPGSNERQRLCDESGLTDNVVPSIQRSAFARLPDAVKPLYRHWVE